ncbi:hypothetical protein VTO42DRAFT_6417 [Malbranchea cinnamomea]
MVMILTWNDFGESHYIGPIHDDGIPEGAARYVFIHMMDGVPCCPCILNLISRDNLSRCYPAPVRRKVCQ